jgi:hypothetical protein
MGVSPPWRFAVVAGLNRAAKTTAAGAAHLGLAIPEGGRQLCDGVLQFGGVHHHAADGGHQLHIVVHDVLTLGTARGTR